MDRKVEMKKDLVSVIVPIYNSEKYLRECLNSIVNQTYQNLDIILVNDGSTDESGLICDKYAKSDKRINVVHKTNGGIADSRNVGLSKAKGEWIVWVDSDDIIHNRHIEVLYAVTSYHNSDITVGGYLAVPDDGRPVDKQITEFYMNNIVILTKCHLYDDSFVKKKSMILTVPWCKICKKELYDGIAYPTGYIRDDTWTTWKLYEKANKVAFFTEPIYYWRNNPESISRRKFDISNFTGLDAYGEQLEYFHNAKKQRYVEIVFAEYLETFFWCYNRMKENQMEVSLLKPYFEYMKKRIGYVKLSNSLGLKQWLRYRYLVWYKIPKLIL